MILPGFPRPMVGGKKDIYTPAIEAITSKTLYARADTSTAAVNSTLNTNNWDNEAIATPDISGNALWRDNQQNGLRGVDTGSTRSASTGRTVTQLKGSGVAFSFFAVEQRTGNGSSNNCVLIGNVYWQIRIRNNSTEFEATMTDTSTVTVPLTAAYTSGAAYVFAISVSTGGIWRVNFNGNIYTGTGIANTWNGGETADLGNHGTNNSMIFEYIMSSAEQSDAVVDAAVDALMEKWGIA